MGRLIFTFPYLAMNDVMKAVKSSDVKIVDQSFDNSCEMTLEFPADDGEALRSRLGAIDGVSLRD